MRNVPLPGGGCSETAEAHRVKKKSQKIDPSDNITAVADSQMPRRTRVHPTQGREGGLTRKTEDRDRSKIALFGGREGDERHTYYGRADGRSFEMRWI